MFRNLFSFNGRIRRTEFGISFIIYIVFYVGLRVFMNTFPDDQAILGIIFLCYIPLLWFLWSQGAKRCHDLNKSGWWQLIPFYVIVLIFQAGNLYPNEYGLNPKDPKLREYDPEYYQDPEDPQLSNDQLL